MEISLEARVYRPEGEPHAVLVIVHGMEEHCRRYRDFAVFLKRHGIAVLTYDLPGHGDAARRGNELGWFGETDGWETLVGSAATAVGKMKKEYPDVPLWLMGHSMGSMIVRCYLQEHDDQVDGVILSGAPAYIHGVRAVRPLIAAAARAKGRRGHSRILDRLITGAYNRDIENPRTDFDWLSYDPENVDRFSADPLCGIPFTIQGYRDLAGGMVAVHRLSAYRCRRPDLPVYFAAGTDDPCIGGPEGWNETVQLLQKAGYRNVHARLYDGMRHEILNERGHEQVYRDMLGIIEEHHESAL